MNSFRYIMFALALAGPALAVETGEVEFEGMQRGTGGSAPVQREDSAEARQLLVSRAAKASELKAAEERKAAADARVRQAEGNMSRLQSAISARGVSLRQIDERLTQIPLDTERARADGRAAGLVKERWAREYFVQKETYEAARRDWADKDRAHDDAKNNRERAERDLRRLAYGSPQWESRNAEVQQFKTIEWEATVAEQEARRRSDNAYRAWTARSYYEDAERQAREADARIEQLISEVSRSSTEKSRLEAENRVDQAAIAGAEKERDDARNAAAPLAAEVTKLAADKRAVDVQVDTLEGKTLAAVRESVPAGFQALFGTPSDMEWSADPAQGALIGTLTINVNGRPDRVALDGLGAELRSDFQRRVDEVVARETEARGVLARLETDLTAITKRRDDAVAARDSDQAARAARQRLKDELWNAREIKDEKQREAALAVLAARPEVQELMRLADRRKLDRRAEEDIRKNFLDPELRRRDARIRELVASASAAQGDFDRQNSQLSAQRTAVERLSGDAQSWKEWQARVRGSDKTAILAALERIARMP